MDLQVRNWRSAIGCQVLAFIIGISVGSQWETIWLYGQPSHGLSLKDGVSLSIYDSRGNNPCVRGEDNPEDEENYDRTYFLHEKSKNTGNQAEGTPVVVGSQPIKTPLEYEEGEGSPALGEVCQRLFSSPSNHNSSWLIPPPSATTVWAQHLEAIAAATNNREGAVQTWADIITVMLPLVTRRLVHSVQAVYKEERQWQRFDRILIQALERYDYLANPGAFDGKAIPTPVKILIMGGSVTGGTGCNVGGMKTGPCSWPTRLKHLLQNLFVSPTVNETVVDIQVIAVGGTLSEFGEMLLNYDMLPDYAKNPDIIIQSYSTNDSVTGVQRAQERNLTYEQELMDMQESFVRTATRPLQPPHCEQQRQPPLLLFLNDYISNPVNGLLKSLLYPQVLHTVSTYYGVAVASYADMIRDLVYGDNREVTFSPPFYSFSKKSYVNEVHPYAQGHIALTWVVAYNLLNLVTTRCGQYHQHQLLQHFQQQTHRAAAGERSAKILPGKPGPRPAVLPPRLLGPLGEDYLTIESITDVWKKEEQASLSQTCSMEQPQSRCSFSWTSTLPHMFQPHVMQQFFKKANVTIDFGANNGWRFGDNKCREIVCVPHRNKLGLVTSGPVGSTVQLTFPVDTIGTEPLSKVTVIYMKSYGLTWENSTAALSVLDAENGERLGSTSLNSYFDGDTRATVITAAEISFEHPGKEKSLQLTANLTSGHSFKIMGLAFCRW